MRTTLLITSLLLGWPPRPRPRRHRRRPSPPSRFAVAAVARIEHVYVDGHTDGTTPVGGVAASVRVSRAIAIEGELTGAAREIARSYEGTFVVRTRRPAAPAGRQFERFAPTARRTLAYVPHLGVAAMVVARTAVNARVGLAGRLGVASRGYSERSSYVVLSIPEGVDPARVARDFQPQTVETVRGGLLLGVDVDLALTPRFTLPLQMRVVYSGPAELDHPAPRTGPRRQRTLAVLTPGSWNERSTASFTSVDTGWSRHSQRIISGSIGAAHASGRACSMPHV